MKNAHAALLKVLPTMALILGLGLAGQPAVAQNSPNSHPNAAVQQQPAPPDDPNSAAETKTFSGKIVKSGDKLVLSDSTSKTTYQLDDQQKAQEFVNQNVKVTGVLDATTGMIRVRAIEPA